MFYKRNKKMSSFLRRLRKNPNKKLNVLLEEDYKAIEFFKNKGFDINYVTLSFFRVCKAKNQLIKLNVNTMNYLNHCFKFSEEETDSKKNFYLVKSLCKFLSRNYYGIFDPSDENLSKIQSLWPIWDKECSSIYKFCTDKKTVKSHLQVIENVAKHLPADGSVWITNNTKYHNAFNGGEENRVHLVACLTDYKFH